MVYNKVRLEEQRSFQVYKWKKKKKENNYRYYISRLQHNSNNIYHKQVASFLQIYIAEACNTQC